jgi:hypothetical protein
MNKYLEKIAAATGDDKYGNMALEGAVGAGLAKGAPQRLLGYHTVYHGTSKANAEAIRKEGFKTKHGGGAHGASSAHPSKTSQEVFTERSKGKIHVTKNPFVAGQFAGFQAARRNTQPGMVKARVSDKMWKSFKRDDDVAGTFGSKDTAATTTHDIKPQFVAGGKGSKGAFAFLKKRHLESYYGNSAGRTRAGKGAAMLVGGGALLAHALSRAHSKLKDDYPL